MLINQREPAEFLTSFEEGTSQQKCFNCEFNLSRPPPTHKIICHISDERDGILSKAHKIKKKQEKKETTATAATEIEILSSILS